MPSTKRLIKCILILLVIGCGPSEVTVFSGSKFQCEKLFEILVQFRIEANRKVEQSSCSIKVRKNLAGKTSELFSKLELTVFDKARPTNRGLTELLVPVLRKSKSFEVDKIEKLRNSPGVIEVGCSDGDEVDSCTIWFLSSQIGKPQIELKIKELFPPNLFDRFGFEDLQELIEANLNGMKDRGEFPEKMIILDPFSFKVLDSEKDIAGAQLILVLGVFLLSGFVLGFWARSNDKK